MYGFASSLQLSSSGVSTFLVLLISYSLNRSLYQNSIWNLEVYDTGLLVLSDSPYHEREETKDKQRSAHEGLGTW